MRKLLFSILIVLCSGGAVLADATKVVSPDVSYEHIGRWDADKLNGFLNKDFPAFSGVEMTYPPAVNGVDLYRVTYNSVIPEQNNRHIVATGLVAVPEVADKSALPLMSYQHGTVYGKLEVPSHPDQSPETQLALALFAGQGYAVIGADYFGMGTSAEPEGYLVKASHQQASYDMYRAAQSVLADLNVGTTDQLFLGGWSQGGFVTMALLEKLEQEGVPVTATATASAPLDVSALLRGFLFFPRKIDANWVNSTIILSAFAFEHYYNVPGLARSVINDAYYDAARKAYLREPVDVSTIPSDLHTLVRTEYFDPKFFDASAYGRLMADTTTYRWVYQSPVRNYYGETDEAISTGVGRLAMTYQQSLGNGNPNVEAISTGDTTHRGTYAKSAAEWKTWFDSLKQ